MRLDKTIFVILVVLCVAGHAAAAEKSETGIPTAELLRAELLEATGGPSNPIPGRAVLAPSDEMREFVDQHVNPGATDVFKLQQLTDAIMGKASFGLEYDENTRTAAETFHLQKGNCLSFSIMFVSLARAAGLDADFQEVDIPPDWSMRKDVFVLNRHINVSINLAAAGVHVVDFNISDFKTTYDLEIVSDRRAIAHFYNNMGVERMQDGDIADAVAFFRLAISQGDGRFSPAWNNLGSLYRRAGHLVHAEAAFLEALRVDKRDEVAMSNLVALYEKIGDRDKADVYRKKVQEHRMRNPYYRYRLANDAFMERDYDAAIEHLKHATRRERSEDEFYFLLGLSYLMNGETKEARKWMTKAEKVAADSAQKKRYSTKIEMLNSASQKVD